MNTNIINNFTFLIWVKLIVLLLLFLFNIHLYFLDSNNTNKNTKNKVLESRLFSNKKFKQYFRYITATYLFYITDFSSNTVSEKKIHLDSNLELSENISTKNEKGIDTFYEEDDTQKSFMLYYFYENIDSLDTYGKLALSMLLLKSVFISVLINLVFIYYGEYLLTKYSIEKRYPRLAIFINLRRKFNKYTIIWNWLMIICILLIEILFYISLLFLR